MPHGANLCNSSAALPGGNPTGQHVAGLLAPALHPVRQDRPHQRGPPPRACGTAFQYPVRPCRGILPWRGCPPAVSAADGHGMILIERRVVLVDATYRVVWAGPGP